jgi:cytochrome c peroxidase
MIMKRKTLLKKVVSVALAAGMLFCPWFPVTPAQAAPGGITNNSGLIPFDQAYFAFEVESVLSTLKEEPTWDEVEKMLDDPYAFVLEPNVRGNEQGFPSYRYSATARRPSFIYRNAQNQPCAPGSGGGCVNVPYPGLLIHPLNYNHMNGEEMRLLNIEYEGGNWLLPDLRTQAVGAPMGLELTTPADPTTVPPTPATYTWLYVTQPISAGATRIEEDEPAIDFNSPSAPNIDPADTGTYICTVNLEFGLIDSTGLPVPEGSIICGGDPGEPGHAGFGVLGDPAAAYSQPAVPGPTGPAASIVGFPLIDPVRGEIGVRDPITGGPTVGALELLQKPSLRIVEVGGTGTAPNYLWNSQAELTARALAALDVAVNAPAYLTPSNENDYVRDRNVAMVLGKAFFWDMQVGSDGVQACASCHFHAGVDNRTKGQLNPNHLGGDLTLQVKASPNEEVVPGDFPFHRLVNKDVPAESINCGYPGKPACGDGVLYDTNDVMSSMGVVFSPFTDIPTPGLSAFGSAPLVLPLLPDIRTAAAADPIPLFQGLRRAEPRNTPTFFAATLNFDNFWDGRARHDFNGGSVFGAADPQSHVMVDDGAGNLVATRQLIRFASLASLATGPGLSNFEMSFDGRNWAKLGKKLLQPGVTPLANQLVDPNDSVLGPYSGQRSAVGGPVDRPGMPGLNVSYPTLIQQAFYPALHSNTTMHLNGCYTDGNAALHPNQCAAGTVAIPVLSNGAVVNSAADPFDQYVLSVAGGPANPVDTNQFTQMEANFPLFWGLSIHLWGSILIPDDSPMDRFYDANPDSFVSFGESSEPGLVLDLMNCVGENNTGNVQPCFTEVGNFKRDPGVLAYQGRTFESDPGTPQPAGGTRVAGDPDPLLGMDLFLGSNLSLKNPNYRSLRCGECHAGGTQTDHTVSISHQLAFIDFVPEFIVPGVAAFPEPLGRERVITGFSLESEINGNAQDAIERNIADLCAVEPCVDAYGAPVPGGVHGGFPQGQAFFDNGVYNIGTRPIFEDVGRGGDDAFGWPLSLGYLMLKNVGGVAYHPGGYNPANGFAQPPGGGIPMMTFDPTFDPVTDPFGFGGGVYPYSPQDQLLNPGFEEEPLNPMLPPHLAPWANNNVVGDEVQQDEIFAGLNTLCREPILEGFLDSFGAFNPAATVGETYNAAHKPAVATWPNVNRVNTQGSFKAPTLRNVELTGPYFHNGSKLTLRQELDFYDRGGDFPKMNSQHRDFLIIRLDEEDEALGGCVDPTILDANGRPTRPAVPCIQAGAVPEFTAQEKENIKKAVIEFLLELTDERVKFERAPFDHPEIFVPLDATAPDNGSLAGGVVAGRQGFMNNLANGLFIQAPAVGEGGNAAPLSNFLNVSSVAGQGISHFDSDTGNPVITSTGDGGGGAPVAAASVGGGGGGGCFIASAATGSPLYMLLLAGMALIGIAGLGLWYRRRIGDVS